MEGEYGNVEDVFTDDEDIFDEDSDDSDDEWEKRRKKLCLALVAYRIIKKKGMKKKRRRTKRRRNRRLADMLLQEGIDDGLFRVEYRMSPKSFRKLVGLIRDDLEPKDASRTRKDYLDPETKVMMTLRWLAGGQYVDQCRRNGVSKPSVFRAFAQVINAINANPEIGHPKWPTNVDECNEIARGWAKLSGPSESRGLFQTVISMVDGILVSTRSPTLSETNRPDDFRSGHKKRLGSIARQFVTLHCAFSSFPSNLPERQMISRPTGCLSCLNLSRTYQKATFVVATMLTAIASTFLCRFLDKIWISAWTLSTTS